MRIAIIGKNGQLGKTLIRYLHDHEIIAYGRDDFDLTGPIPPLHADVIINAAAYTAVDKAEDEADLAFAVNCSAVKNLAQDNSRLIHISTDYVFDGEKDAPYLETDAPNPLNVYGKSKLAGEIEALHAGGLVLRTSWLYSTHGNNFLTIMQRLAKQQPLRVVHDQIGSPTSVYVLAGVIRDILLQGSVPSGLYHISCSGQASRHEFARAILPWASIEPVASSQYQTHAARPTYSALESQNAKRVFGLHLPDWRTELQRVLAY